MPTAGSDFFDYRGLETPSRIPARGPDGFRLGRARTPKGRWRLTDSELFLTASEMNMHALIAAPSGVGKTAGLIIPWIYAALQQGQSVIAVDVKGNLKSHLRKYVEYRGPLGVHVVVWDYSQPGESCSWNWMDDLTSESAIEAAVEAILGEERQNDSQPFHARRDARILTAILALRRYLPDQTAQGIRDLLVSQSAFGSWLATVTHESESVDLIPLMSYDTDAFENAVSGIGNGLKYLASPEVRRVTETPDLRLEAIDRYPTLLIVGAPSAGKKTAATTSGLMLAMLTHRWLQGFTAPARPIFVVLDEAPKIQKRVSLTDLLSLGREAGLSVALAAQDITQFDKETRDQVLANVETFVALPKVGSATSKFLAERLGEHHVAMASRGGTGKRFGEPHGETRTVEYRSAPVLDHRAIAYPPFEGRPAIVHARSMSAKPILVDLSRPDLGLGCRAVEPNRCDGPIVAICAPLEVNEVRERRDRRRLT